VNTLSDSPLTPSLAFCGYSGSGKTELLLCCLKLLKELAFSPAVLKSSSEVHAAIASKDSQRFFNEGATAVGFMDPAQTLLHLPGRDLFHRTTDPEVQLRRQVPFDILLREGGKQSNDWKVVCVDPGQGIPDLDNSKVLAFWAGVPGSKSPALADESLTPCFGLAEEAKLLDHCLQKLRRIQREKLVKAAVLVGGQSTRMGQPKAWLKINGSPMVLKLAHLSEELLGVSRVVFGGSLPPVPNDLSLSQHQELERYAVIPDRVRDFGPWGGLLGLWEAEPNTTWLVLGCDYPSLNLEALEWLLSQRDPLRLATLARHEAGPLETMIGIYEPGARYLLEAAWLEGGKQMNRRMQQWPLRTLNIPQHLQACWQGINMPEDLEQLVKQSSAQ
jgi:molybdopterin-guanine dinucleotide biosynthesis protein A